MLQLCKLSTRGMTLPALSDPTQGVRVRTGGAERPITRYSRSAMGGKNGKSNSAGRGSGVRGGAVRVGPRGEEGGAPRHQGERQATQQVNPGPEGGRLA